MSEKKKAAESTEPTEPTEKLVRVNLSLTKDTHKALKLYCVGKGVTLQAELSKMIDKAFAARVQ